MTVGQYPAATMKCLLVSDLHYTLKQFDWLHAVAERFDLLVLAGDHLDISSAVAADAQIVVILKYLKRLAERTRVIVCSGNHDLNARSAGGERVAGWMARVREIGVPVDGDFLALDGVDHHRVPVVGRPDVLRRGGRAARARLRAPRGALDLGVSRPARRIAGQLGGAAPLRRRRAAAVDPDATSPISC